MSTANVAALQPFIAVVDVTVKFFLAKMRITLCFGPFNTMEETERWCDVFLVERKILQKTEAKTHMTGDEIIDFFNQPYLMTFTGNPDIIQPPSGGREKDAFIPPGDPIVAAREVCTYALLGQREVINDALRHLSETTKGA